MIKSKKKEPDTLEIRISIQQETDLYNPFDPDQQLLSDEVINYIQRRSEEGRTPGDRLLIHIISANPLNQERVRECFDQYLYNELTILTKQQRLTRLKQARLFIIGFVFIVIWLYFAVNTDNVGVEILSIIGSFSIWEAADIWIVEDPQLRLKKRRIEHLRETKIIFTERNDQ